MKTLASILSGMMCCSVGFSQGLGWAADIPADSTSGNDGNSSLFRPFVNPPNRFQQVYAASNFPGISSTTGAGYVNTLYFRVDAPTGFDFSGIASNLEIRLSTTSKGPDSLSPVFAENVGADEAIVVGPANTLVSGRRVFGIFTVRIDLTTGFLYRPNDGNLLLDIRCGGGVAGILDAWDRVGDSVGSVYGNLNDPSGFASTIGLPTHFEGTLAVPEPSAFVLIGTAGVLLWLFRNRRS